MDNAESCESDVSDVGLHGVEVWQVRRVVEEGSAELCGSEMFT